MDTLANAPPGCQPVDLQTQAQLRQHVESLLRLRPNQFPGAQPVSFLRSHLDSLCQQDYFVSEKSDGTRYLLLITNHLRTPQQQESFLIDRKNNYHHAPRLFFPQPTPSLSHPHDNVLLDGELVLDRAPDNKATIPRFLVFDLLLLAGQSLLDRPFTSRLGRLKEHVITPYQRLLKQKQQFATAPQLPPFSVEMKHLEKSYGLQNVLDSIPQLRHDNDGLLFTSATAPYQLGTCETMLKWKPPSQNTIDFKIRVVGGPVPPYRYELYVLQNANQFELFGELVPDNPEMIRLWSMQPPDGKIAECYYNADYPTHWMFMRFREDKDTPNHISVARRIMESIQNGVAQEQLADRLYLERVRSNWKQRELNQKLEQKRL